MEPIITFRMSLVCCIAAVFLGLGVPALTSNYALRGALILVGIGIAVSLGACWEKRARPHFSLK